MPSTDNDTWWLVPIDSRTPARRASHKMPVRLRDRSVLRRIDVLTAPDIPANTTEKVEQIRNFARLKGHLGASPDPRTSLRGNSMWLHSRDMLKPTTNSAGPFTLQGVKEYIAANPAQFGSG